MKVITFSTKFPSYHPRKGEPTNFKYKILRGIGIDIQIGENNESISLENFDPKYNTIRKGHRWKPGDWFKPVIWGNDINPKSGRSGAYHSKQIQIAQSILVKKVWDFEINKISTGTQFLLNGDIIGEYNNYMLQFIGHEVINKIAKNDGLTMKDFLAWFQYPKPFDGQIICWNDKIEY